MATKVTTPADRDYPVRFEVTNTGKRTRSRLGRNFHAARGKDKPEPVVVEVTSPAEYLRLKACKDLQLKPTKAKATQQDGGGQAGSEAEALADRHNSDELKEMATERELSTSGTKVELAGRILEHDTAQDGGS